MLTKTNLTVLIIAMSSVSALYPGYFQNGTPIFGAGLNGRNFPQTFNGVFTQNNGVTGTFTATNGAVANVVNGVVVDPNFTTVNGQTIFTGNNGITTPIGNNIVTGLDSLAPFFTTANTLGTNGAFTSTDGTFVRPAFNNFFLRGFRDNNYANRNVRYATLPNIDSNVNQNQFELPRVTPVSAPTTQSTYDCISEDCNDEYYPVCGANNRTYRNQCQLQCFGVDLARDGQCVGF